MIVTSMGPKGYEQYGKRFIETFIEQWPENEELVVYLEEPVDFEHPRVTFRNLLSVEGMIPFLDTVLASNPIFRGLRLNKTQYDYHFDAFKFARKVFSIADAAADYQGAMAWIDADVYTHSKVPEGFVKSVLEGVYTAYLGRPNMYTEAGFIAFDTTHPAHQYFMNLYIGSYLSGAFVYLGEWHDCYVYDFVRIVTGVPGNDLAAGLNPNHPFVESVLGEYMDHVKGEERKKAGKSPELRAPDIKKGIEEAIEAATKAMNE